MAQVRAVRVVHVYLDFDVVERMDTRSCQSPEDLLTEVEGMLEDGEDISDIQQYYKDHAS